PTEVVARDYDEPTIPIEDAQRLFDAGFDNGLNGEQAEGWPGFLHGEYVEPPEGHLWVDGEEAYVHIIMFFMGYGFGGWEFQIVSDETPLLLGDWSAILGNRPAGYGLFAH